MRINVYNEELTERVQFSKENAKTGNQFYRLAFHLASPKELHHSQEDDDTSAVVFWSDTREKVAALLSAAIERVESYREADS
jgi:hypothetical protein